MNIRKRILSGILLMTALGTWGCSEAVSYKDGTYEARSSVYEDGEVNGYGEINITIKDGRITDAVFETFEPDGTLKDEEYGKKGGDVKNRDFYNKAQKAVAACREYAAALVANGSLDGIDAISGATINYDQFVESAKMALDAAKE